MCIIACLSCGVPSKRKHQSIIFQAAKLYIVLGELQTETDSNIAHFQPFMYFHRVTIQSKTESQIQVSASTRLERYSADCGIRGNSCSVDAAVNKTGPPEILVFKVTNSSSDSVQISENSWHQNSIKQFAHNGIFNLHFRTIWSYIMFRPIPEHI